jgi:hypothetical protein
MPPGNDIDRLSQWLERAGTEITLVGGQAVALWEHLLGLPQQTETVDIDFLGDASEALGLAEGLGLECRVPAMDDQTPNTAILVNPQGEVVADFLAYVVGVNETDIRKRRLPVTSASGHVFYVLHPFDCLASRLANTASLPSKRTPQGYAQLRSAVAVCQAYIARLLGGNDEREAIRLANRVFDLALTDGAKRVYLGHDIDLLEAIPPISLFLTDSFREENHPRRCQEIADRRDRYRRFLERFSK